VGIDECGTCKKGFYSSDPGASTCLTCNPGKYTNKEQTACLLCPAGKISGVAASSCDVCEKNKYAEGEGNTECQFCDDEDMLIGSITLKNGTTSASGCICPAGEYVDFGENLCGKVPEGVNENVEAMTVKNLQVEKGYWRTNSSSSEVLQCLAPEHCVGGSDPDTQCNEGHTGPLCAVCEDGYASTGSGLFLKCSTCDGGDANTTIAVGFGIFFSVIFALMGLTCCCKRKKKKRGGGEDDQTELTSNDR
jgi:hypothetical protein